MIISIYRDYYSFNALYFLLRTQIRVLNIFLAGRLNGQINYAVACGIFAMTLIFLQMALILRRFSMSHWLDPSKILQT